MGKGEKIFICNHAWIPGSYNYKLVDLVNIGNLEKVAELIEPISRVWRNELITGAFGVSDVERILQKIFLAHFEICKCCGS